LTSTIVNKTPVKGSKINSKGLFQLSWTPTLSFQKLFLFCPRNNNGEGAICALCGVSDFNPRTGENDGKERLFCGQAPPAWDISVESLPKCPLEMNKREISSWQRKMKKSIPLRRRG
jgi:hypothetical protein